MLSPRCARATPVGQAAVSCRLSSHSAAAPPRRVRWLRPAPGRHRRRARRRPACASGRREAAHSTSQPPAATAMSTATAPAAAAIQRVESISWPLGALGVAHLGHLRRVELGQPRQERRQHRDHLLVGRERGFGRSARSTGSAMRFTPQVAAWCGCRRSARHHRRLAGGRCCGGRSSSPFTRCAHRAPDGFAQPAPLGRQVTPQHRTPMACGSRCSFLPWPCFRFAALRARLTSTTATSTAIMATMTPGGQRHARADLQSRISCRTPCGDCPAALCTALILARPQPPWFAHHLRTGAVMRSFWMPPAIFRASSSFQPGSRHQLRFARLLERGQFDTSSLGGLPLPAGAFSGQRGAHGGVSGVLHHLLVVGSPACPC